MAKLAVLELQDCPKLISRKSWMTEKSWNIHTVDWESIRLILAYFPKILQKQLIFNQNGWFLTKLLDLAQNINFLAHFEKTPLRMSINDILYILDCHISNLNFNEKVFWWLRNVCMFRLFCASETEILKGDYFARFWW